jgi:hypothetical protein
MLRGIDSKVSVNKGLWELAECFANGATPTMPETVSLMA